MDKAPFEIWGASWAKTMHSLPRKEAIAQILTYLGYNELLQQHKPAVPGQITMPENDIKADRPYHDLEWQSAQYGIQLKICGDSKVVVD